MSEENSKQPIREEKKNRWKQYLNLQIEQEKERAKHKTNRLYRYLIATGRGCEDGYERFCFCLPLVM